MRHERWPISVIAATERRVSSGVIYQAWVAVGKDTPLASGQAVIRVR